MDLVQRSVCRPHDDVACIRQICGLRQHHNTTHTHTGLSSNRVSGVQQPSGGSGLFPCQRLGGGSDLSFVACLYTLIKLDARANSGSGSCPYQWLGGEPDLSFVACLYTPKKLDAAVSSGAGLFPYQWLGGGPDLLLVACLYAPIKLDARASSGSGPFSCQ